MTTALLPFEPVSIPAAGAFATLVLARASDGELRALKVLKPELVQNGDALTRLRDEARILTRIRHPNVIRVDGLLYLDDRPVLVMEWVRGIDLGVLVRRHPTGVDARVACELVRDVAAALHAVWEAPDPETGAPLRVVHRDIKPENALLSAEGVVKLIDFGTATGAFSDRESRTQDVIIGSRGYVAPERSAGAAPAPSGDVYALGLTFFQLLTGKAAVVSSKQGRHDAAVFQLLDRIHSDSLDDDALNTVRHLVRRMCLFEADLRPTSARVAEDLTKVLGEVESALPAFAAAEVAPVEAVRGTGAIEQQPGWANVRFLTSFKEARTLHDAPPDSASDAAARDLALAARLASPDWFRRVPELQLLLTRHPRWTKAPFEAILQRALAPRWQFWITRPSAQELAVTLEFVAQRADADLLQLCAPLTQHPDPRVATAAAALDDD